MSKRAHHTARRADGLSKARIVEAAIEILDARGEDALTFRALATQLATGSGAIYWHIADRNDLLAAATGDVLARALAKVGRQEEPGAAIRAIALAVFDAIDAHPWAGAHLSREPWHSAVGEIFERIGGWLQPLGVPADAQFDCASALTNYILGVAGQNAANARTLPGGTDRKAWLEAMAAGWIQDAPESRPFLRRVAAQLSVHDDRQQFLAGVDFILTGACAKPNGRAALTRRQPSRARP
ncbi:AcrR family transcriptional regulator [Bradyrhizobium sp. USDA 4515]